MYYTIQSNLGHLNRENNLFHRIIIKVSQVGLYLIYIQCL